jgi:hypothetical protein
VVIDREGVSLEPEEVTALFVSEGYFTSLGARPALGRLFGGDELAPPAGAGRDPEPPILGETIRDGPAAVGSMIRLAGGQPSLSSASCLAGFQANAVRRTSGYRSARDNACPELATSWGAMATTAGSTQVGAVPLSLGRIARRSSIGAVRAELALRIAQRAA